MIGNDIVDLKHINTDWKRPRFLDKVFTPNEQAIISNSDDQHQMVWLFWSMKEAAYKCHVQRNGKRFFNPKRLECEFISEDKGIVRIDDNSYFTDSTITEDYIYSIAEVSKHFCVNSALFENEYTSYKVQSDSLKLEFIESISINLGMQTKSLNIKKTEIGVPELFSEDEKLSIHLSLTHCGRYSAFVY